MMCSECLQSRPRAFFAAGVCEQCKPEGPFDPLPEGPTWPLGHVLAFAALYHDGHTWVPEGEARDKGVKSSAAVMLEMVAVSPELIDPAAGVPFGIPQVLEWVGELLARDESTCSPWQNAVVKLYRTGWVTPETFPLAASIYHGWWRDTNRESEKTPAAPTPASSLTGKHYGVVGERFNIPACQCVEFKELGLNPDHPEWGESFLLKFFAQSGEELVWFASAGGKFDPKPGGTYNIRCTVKKHEEFNGRRTTTITRCEEFDPLTGKPLAKYARKKKVDDAD